MWATGRERWLVLLAVPPLLLPEFCAPLLPVAVAFLLLVVGARLLAGRGLRFGGALDVAVLLLLIMLPVSLWVSSDPTRSFPKFTTTIIGLFLFWSLATGLPRAGLRRAGVLLGLSGAGLAVLGLLGTDWPRSKVLYIADLYERLPRLMMSLPRSTRGRFDPNEVAGALVMLLPVVLAVLVGVWVERRQSAAVSLADVLPARRWPTVLTRPALLLALLGLTLAAMLGVFVLMQSRGAMVALAIGLAALLVLRERRAIISIAAAAALAVLYDVGPGGGNLAVALSAGQALAGDTASASGRIEMWGNALRAIADYPLTGSGLHTFPAVSWANYVYYAVSPTWNMTHAHNAYLQAGVDFGVIGLAGFLLLVCVLLWRGLCFLRSGPAPFEAWLACGILGGLTGHLVHSLVDVAGRPLGDKPGLIFWVMAGVLVAADRHALHDEGRALPRTARRVLLPAAAVVALLSLTVWAVALGPLAPVARLDLGAVALDQARLKPGLSAGERSALLARAERLLADALPWRADTVYLRLGLVADAQGQAEQARAYWLQTPLALPFLLAQSDALALKGQPIAARAYVEHALAVAPASSSALYRSGTLALADGRTDDALAALQKALDLHAFADGAAERGETYAAIGSIMTAQGRWADAVAVYQQAQAIAPQFSWQRELAMALLRRDGNTVAADALLRESIARTPGQAASYVGLMDILYASGRSSEAIDLGITTIRRFPEASEPLILLGRIYAEQKAWDQAESMFQRAVTLRPRQPEARLWLVRIAMERKQPKVAVALLDEAIALMPDQAIYYVTLGDVRLAMSDTAAAAQAYRRALELDPENSMALKGLDSLPH